MASDKQNSGYISRAVLSNARVSPRKARLVADLVRGKMVGDAIQALEYCDKKTAPLVRKLVLSAVANAVNQSGVDADELQLKHIRVDEGQIFKRWLPRAHGRATPLLKRHSTITVELDEKG